MTSVLGEGCVRQNRTPRWGSSLIESEVKGLDSDLVE